MISIGIDIGTSSIKIVAIDCETKDFVFEISKATKTANVIDKSTEESKLHFEQNVKTLRLILKSLLSEIEWNNVKNIQLCGQMHGIVLWNSNDPINIVSNLITWEDKRCTNDFIKNLPIKSNIPVSTGYGIVTLFWLSKMNLLLNYNMCGTIHDYFTFL
jgi:sugar (pentulose or hexulose) kinase